MSSEENIKIILCRLCTKSAENVVDNDLFNKCNKFMLQQIKELTGMTLKDIPDQMLPRHFCMKCKEDLPRACGYRRLVIMSQNFFKSKDFTQSFDNFNEDKSADKNKSQLFDTVYVSPNIKNSTASAGLEETGFERKETESEDDFDWSENTPAECVETLIEDIKTECFDDEFSESSGQFPEHNFVNENSIAVNMDDEATTASNLNPIKEDDDGKPVETTTKIFKKSKVKINELKEKKERTRREKVIKMPKAPKEKKLKEKKPKEKISKEKIPKERKPRIVDPDKKLFVCEQCGASFYSKPGLVAHLLRHTGERKFACEICEVKFFSIYELQRHIRFHTGEAPYQCRHCDRRFRDYSHRQRHERSKHLNVRPFACSICDKTFTNNYIAKNHMLTHTKLRQFECKICEKYFLRQTHLFTHYRSVTHKNNAAKFEKLDETLPSQPITDIWSTDAMLKALANQPNASMSTASNQQTSVISANVQSASMSTNLQAAGLSSTNLQTNSLNSDQQAADISKITASNDN